MEIKNIIQIPALLITTHFRSFYQIIYFFDNFIYFLPYLLLNSYIHNIDSSPIIVLYEQIIQHIIHQRLYYTIPNMPTQQQHPRQSSFQFTLWNKYKQQHNIQQEQYAPQDMILNWLSQILHKYFQNQSIHAKQEMIQFMKQVHGLDDGKVSNVQFKYDEAVELLQWVRKKKMSKRVGNEQQNQQQQAQRQQLKENGQEKRQQHDQKLNQMIKERQDKQNISKNQSKIQQNKQNHPEQEQQQETYRYPHDAARDNSQKNGHKNNSNEQNQNEQPDQEDGNQFNQFGSNLKVNEDQGNDQIGKNYKQYLKVIFDHYCRMSYATGNDPTFQQIQQKTHVMTINKFMIFCKEFGVVKLNSVNRSYLVELFKKNSQFYKEMNFQQFLQVLLKISQLVFNQEGQNTEELNQYSKQFQQLLLFLQVNNLKVFKKKIQSLNISYRARAEANNTVKKPVLSNYKFKYSANSGKSQEEVKQIIQQRKRIRSENKLKIYQQKKKQQTHNNIQGRVRQQHEKRNINSRPSLRSTPAGNSSTQKKLNPPKPPAKRPTAQPISRKTQASHEGQVTGYANIYRLKKGKQITTGDERLKLNSIVQQAKKMVGSNQNEYQNYLMESHIKSRVRQTPASYYQNDLDSYSRGPSLSEYSQNSQQYSQQDLGSYRQTPIPRRYQPYGHSQLSKRHQKKQNNPDLQGLLDNDSEQDEYLNEHLHRQKRNDLITRRIQAKIKQIDQE